MRCWVLWEPSATEMRSDFSGAHLGSQINKPNINIPDNWCSKNWRMMPRCAMWSNWQTPSCSVLFLHDYLFLFTVFLSHFCTARPVCYTLLTFSSYHFRPTAFFLSSFSLSISYLAGQNFIDTGVCLRLTCCLLQTLIATSNRSNTQARGNLAALCLQVERGGMLRFPCLWQNWHNCSILGSQ